jgi:8-hydroxy-5-deazaflavin:NADPH oxidoreductase
MEAFRRWPDTLRLAVVVALFSFTALGAVAQTETAPVPTPASAAPAATDASAPEADAAAANPSSPAPTPGAPEVNAPAVVPEPAPANTSSSSPASPATQAKAPSPAPAAPAAINAGSRDSATGASAPPAQSLKIGIIGAGNIGATLASLWAKAGYEVMISSRHPERLKSLASRIGEKARVGTPREAAVFGDVVLIAVPYAAMPQVGRDYASVLADKVVLDTGNPYPARDGDMALRANEKGAGLASKDFLPGVKLVRAFNAIRASDLRSEAHRETRVAVPIASDYADALEAASKLVRDAGFEPVVVGDLAQSRKFDVNYPAFVRLMSGPELKSALGIKSAQ